MGPAHSRAGAPEISPVVRSPGACTVNVGVLGPSSSFYRGLLSVAHFQGERKQDHASEGAWQLVRRLALASGAAGGRRSLPRIPVRVSDGTQRPPSHHALAEYATLCESPYFPCLRPAGRPRDRRL